MAKNTKEKQEKIVMEQLAEKLKVDLPKVVIPTVEEKANIEKNLQKKFHPQIRLVCEFKNEHNQRRWVKIVFDSENKIDKWDVVDSFHSATRIKDLDVMQAITLKLMSLGHQVWFKPQING